MQGLVDLLCQQAIRFNREKYVGRFYADFELIEVETIEMIDVAHRGFEQRLRRWLAVFFLQIFFQGAGVNADTDRNIFIAGAVHDHANTLFVTDIARVNTQAIDAVFGHFQCDAVVEVDISHQRNADLLFDQLERLSGIHGWDGDANNIRAYTL